MRVLTDDYKHRGLRKALISTIQEKGISDELVLTAIGSVPRHFFFDDAFLEHAYEDKAFPIGEGQTISQPYTVAFQTELLQVKPQDKVLEIGTGSGYQACVLLEMGAMVFTVEYKANLYQKTKKKLPAMGYRPYFLFGDGSKGWKNQAPYDKILVTAGAPNVPASLTEQLNDNGVLVIPVGNNKRQRMLRVTKKKGKLMQEEFNYFSFVPLLGEKGWQNRK